MRESLVALASAAAGALVAVDEAGFAFDSAVLLGMAWALGGLQNARKRYEAEVKWSSKLVDREREAEAQLTVSRERTRIAHEIHDVVAHGVGVMIMQAAGARRSLRGDLARAERAMVDVEQTGRRSLAEIRRLLGLLDTHDEPELAPQPGLGRLDDLLEDFRRADLPVDLIVDGHRRELPQGVDLSAFRIVQEGLTNVLKHAGHVPVEVTLRYRDDRLGVEVSNRGNGRIVQPPESSPGRGLIGMRERAALLGGTFRAAPQPDGGFRVECELPVNGA
jgi:signal transduction histidine kinase